MVRIRKEKGGSGVGPYWWPEEDPVCEVPEELARDLLARPEEGWSLEPDPEPQEPGTEAGDPDGDSEPDAGDQGAGDDDQEKPPAKTASRRRKPSGTSQA